MDDLDPKILEYAKSVYGPSCEFVRSTDWSYTFRCGEKSYCRISRFMVEKGIVISAAEFRQRWQSMDERGRVDFAMSFHPRADWKANDSEILDVMIEDGSDPIWRCCALAMLEHRDRDRVVRLLIERVRHATDEGARINYMQALGLAGDRRAVEVMRPHYEKYLRDMELEREIGVPDDIWRGPIPYHQFLCVAGDLFKIERSGEYEQVIRKYVDHPNEQVRWWAEHALGIEGPTTLSRNAEHEKKYRAERHDQ